MINSSLLKALSSEHYIDWTIMDEIRIVKLLNEVVGIRCENVCFFNTVIQLLYSIPRLHTCLFNPIPKKDVDANVIMAMRHLFNEMYTKDVVKTSIYVTQFKLEDYTLYSQYDAQECLISILDKILPSTSPFTIDIMSKIWCSKCNHQINKAGEETFIINLNLIQPYTDKKSIAVLFNNYFNPSGTKQEEYRCEGCGSIGSTNLAPVLNSTSEYALG